MSGDLKSIRYSRIFSKLTLSNTAKVPAPWLSVMTYRRLEEVLKAQVLMLSWSNGAIRVCERPSSS